MINLNSSSQFTLGTGITQCELGALSMDCQCVNIDDKTQQQHTL